MVDAVILGGGTFKGPDATETPSKALLKIDNKPMVEYLIDTLRDTPSVRRVVAIVPLSAQYESWTSRIEKTLPAGNSLIDNIRFGIEYLENHSDGGTDKIILTSCDIPLVTSEAIQDFIDRCIAADADFCYPIISREVIEAAYPGTKRTYIKMKEGFFTGGNVMMVAPEVVLKNFDLLDKAYGLRKNPLKMSMALGPKFIAKFLTKTLSVPDAEERVETMIKAKSRAVIVPYPEIGIDVDKPEDLELVEKVLRAPNRR